MEDPTSLQCQNHQIESSCYQCPCGKGYKSYPALYTHIKKKHFGKPPGIIKKPKILPKKRGRPSTQKFKGDLTNGKKVPSNFGLVRRKDLTEQDYIAKIIAILKQLPQQQINKNRLNELGSLLEMNVYLRKKVNNQERLHIGNIASQFLQIISSQLIWEKFEHLYILLMVFIQFIIDELSNKAILSGPIDLLCEYINDFIQTGVAGMIKLFEIECLHIFRDEVMLEIFQAFFNWLLIKRYSSYKITLNVHFKKVETSQDF